MAPSTAQPASNMVPNYEVKLLMDPTVILDLNNKLKRTVLETFTVATTVTKMNVQFLDANDKILYNMGWSPRIRKVQGKADFELTYKKRYKIVNGDIDAALTAANKDTFDSTTTTYEAQVDWGYKNQTLSINRDESYSDSGKNAIELPSEKHSRKMLIEKAPDKFNDSVGKDWGTDKLKKSRIYGPVLAERYTGTWSGEELNIEVWPIKDATGMGTEFIIEASFKVKKRTKALEKHLEPEAGFSKHTLIEYFAPFLLAQGFAVFSKVQYKGLLLIEYRTLDILEPMRGSGLGDAGIAGAKPPRVHSNAIYFVPLAVPRSKLMSSSTF
ncbi:hypothetical protein V491_06459 [Pseudogymnoascus sp. VKM F-3775]|nr:hypothetical protein V491_06459 [Pseudogymnoascus sp. VKM F-3775]